MLWWHDVVGMVEIRLSLPGDRDHGGGGWGAPRRDARAAGRYLRGPLKTNSDP